MSRILDIVGALIGLVLASPVLAAASAAIKTADRGPVLYRQERIGKDGKPFQIAKLRTMTVGAEAQGLGLAVAHRDARITGPGHVLRATSLDEVPQLWNIVRGDMAIVGPRPTVRSQVERYTSEQARRLEVRPGLTGWAQINGRNALPWPDRIRLDVWYVDHRSVWLDLRIIARTPLTLLRRQSIYGPDGITRGL